MDSGDGMVKNRMRIGLIVGNPPYQQKIVGNDRDRSLYNLFMDAASAISDEYVMVTPAKFLVNAGVTPKNWNRKMLNSSHYRVIKYYAKSSEVFGHAVRIAGGIVVSHYDVRTDYKPIEVFIIDRKTNQIIDTVVGSDGFKGMDIIMNVPSKFNLSALYSEHPELESRVNYNGKDKIVRTNYFDRFPEIFPEEKPDCGNEYVKIYGVSGQSRTHRYVKKCYLDTDMQPNYSDYKVLIPEAWNRGGLIEAHPGDANTQTYYSIGNRTAEANHNCCKYLMSNFVWFMLCTLKKTYHNSIRTWKNVPLQDFTDDSDIDWSKSIPEIDRQLYAKYGLTDEEIEYIETRV